MRFYGSNVLSCSAEVGESLAQNWTDEGGVGVEKGKLSATKIKQCAGIIVLTEPKMETKHRLFGQGSDSKEMSLWTISAVTDGPGPKRRGEREKLEQDVPYLFAV